MTFSQFKGTSKNRVPKTILLVLLLILLGILTIVMTVLITTIQEPDDVSVAARQGDCIAEIACNIDQFCVSYLYARYFEDSPSVCPANYGYCACDNTPIPDDANQRSSSSTTTSNSSTTSSSGESSDNSNSSDESSTTTSGSSSSTSSSSSTTTTTTTTTTTSSSSSSTTTTTSTTTSTATTISTTASTSSNNTYSGGNSSGSSGVGVSEDYPYNSGELPATGQKEDTILLIGIILLIVGGITKMWATEIRKK